MSKGSNWREAEVQCPFYRLMDIDKRRITCEGITDRSLIAQFYQDKKGFNQQLELFCCASYKSCEIYNTLMYYKYPEDK